jgi:hypothetical protein
MERRTFGALTVIGVAAAAALVWGHRQSERLDPVYDDERVITASAKEPPTQITLPPGFELATESTNAEVDPRLIDVVLDGGGVRVRGRVVDLPMALGETSGSDDWKSCSTPLSMVHALDWAKRVVSASGTPTASVNLVVDARTSYRAYARTLQMLYCEGLSASLVFRRPDGAMGVAADRSPWRTRCERTVRLRLDGSGYEVARKARGLDELTVEMNGAQLSVAQGPAPETSESPWVPYGVGCLAGAPGPTIPKRDGQTDPEALVACLHHVLDDSHRRLVDTVPCVVLSAPATFSFGDVAAAEDAAYRVTTVELEPPFE